MTGSQRPSVAFRTLESRKRSRFSVDRWRSGWRRSWNSSIWAKIDRFRIIQLNHLQIGNWSNMSESPVTLEYLWSRESCFYLPCFSTTFSAVSNTRERGRKACIFMPRRKICLFYLSTYARSPAPKDYIQCKEVHRYSFDSSFVFQHFLDKILSCFLIRNNVFPVVAVLILMGNMKYWFAIQQDLSYFFLLSLKFFYYLCENLMHLTFHLLEGQNFYLKRYIWVHFMKLLVCPIQFTYSMELKDMMS